MGTGTAAVLANYKTYPNCVGDICDVVIFDTSKIGVYTLKAQVQLHSDDVFTTEFLTVTIGCAAATTVLSQPSTTQPNLNWEVNQDINVVDMMPFQLTKSYFTVCGFKDYKISVISQAVEVSTDASLITYPNY